MLRTLVRSVAVAVLALVGGPALAQDYPNKPVKIIVPFAAGGPADVFARFVGQRLSETMGQPFVIDDRPGAGSVIGTDAVAKSAPDGYTLLMMSNAQTVNESLIPNKPYALLRDFAPVAPVNYSDLVLVIHPSVQANTLADLIRLAKASPGKLNYASSGPGTPYHMAGELFKAMAGVDIVHIPYKGSAAAMMDLIGGQTHLMMDVIPSALPQVKGGKVRVIGVTGSRRIPELPDVPTVAESGLPGFDVAAWWGVLGPSGMPAPIVDRISAALNRQLESAEFRKSIVAIGLDPAAPVSPAEFDRIMRQDAVRFGAVVKDVGIHAD